MPLQNSRLFLIVGTLDTQSNGTGILVIINAFTYIKKNMQINPNVTSSWRNNVKNTLRINTRRTALLSNVALEKKILKL